MSATITCPLCRAQLPVAVLPEPRLSDDGLTILLDASFVEEHISMHTHCICDWHGVMLMPDLLCPVHGA